MRVLAVILILLINISFSNAKADAKQIALVKPEQKQDKLLSTNDLFKSYLELSAFKNKVISQNLANINTPGYKADEVEMPTNLNDLASGRSARKVKLSRTSDKHINGNKNGDSKFASRKLKDPDEIKKNGNNVSLRQQMTKLSQNKTDYAAAVKGYATINSLFSTVVGK